MRYSIVGVESEAAGIGVRMIEATTGSTSTFPSTTAGIARPNEELKLTATPSSLVESLTVGAAA
jgi:hypothetical protein